MNIPPTKIFNCDETAMRLCPNSEKVLAAKGSQVVYKVVNADEKESITTLFTFTLVLRELKHLRWFYIGIKMIYQRGYLRMFLEVGVWAIQNQDE